MNENKKSGLAVAGLVVGILAIVFCFIPIINFLSYVLGILAVIFGIIPLFKKKSIAMAIIAIILGVASIFVAQTINSGVANAIDEAVDETTEELDDMSGENTDDLLGTKVEVELGEVVIDEYGLATLEAKVTNISDESMSFTILVEAVDSEGNRVDETYIYANNLGAGQSTTEEAMFTADSEQLEAATIKIVEVSAF